eukprot:4937850-Pleurochrysis_carterae.AAC.1
MHGGGRGAGVGRACPMVETAPRATRVGAAVRVKPAAAIAEEPPARMSVSSSNISSQGSMVVLPT